MTMINTNVGALLARTYATRAAERMQTAMERLSSGKRINNAADDAAGLAVANKMQSQLGGIKTAIRNSQDGISVTQTADGALGEISKLILRMRELAVQMQNGIYTAQDRSNAQMEVRALLAEIDKITNNTQYNKVNLLDGTYDQTIRAGNTNAETIRLSIGSTKTSETAKIVNFAVEKAIGHTSSSPSRANTQNELEVFEATTVEVDTSVWSSTFATSFNTDSLGTFSFTNDGGAGDDNADFNLDPKTGKLTSKAAIVSGTGGSGNSPADTPGADNVGTAAVTNGQFKVQVTYTHRNGTTTHVEKLEINVKDKTETTLFEHQVGRATAGARDAAGRSRGDRGSVIGRRPTTRRHPRMSSASQGQMNRATVNAFQTAIEAYAVMSIVLVDTPKILPWIRWACERNPIHANVVNVRSPRLRRLAHMKNAVQVSRSV